MIEACSLSKWFTPKDCDYESCNVKIWSPISLDTDVAISSAFISMTLAVSPWEASCLKTWWILSRPPSRSSDPLSKTLLHLSHVFLPTDRCSTSHDYQDLIVKPSVDFESMGFEHKNVLGFHTKSSWAENWSRVTSVKALREKPLDDIPGFIESRWHFENLFKKHQNAKAIGVSVDAYVTPWHLRTHGNRCVFFPGAPNNQSVRSSSIFAGQTPGTHGGVRPPTNRTKYSANLRTIWSNNLIEFDIFLKWVV